MQVLLFFVFKGNKIILLLKKYLNTLRIRKKTCRLNFSLRMESLTIKIDCFGSLNWYQ